MDIGPGCFTIIGGYDYPITSEVTPKDMDEINYY